MIDKNRPVTVDLLQKVLNTIDEKLAEVLVPIFVKQKARIGELEIRIKELEASQLQFKGTHDESRTYLSNHIVRRSGSMWICTAPTHGTFEHKCWELLVKRGDAR